MTGFFQTIKELRFYQVTDSDRGLVSDLLDELKALKGEQWEQSADKFLLNLSRHFASEFFHYYYHEGNAVKRYYRKHISSLDDGFTFAAGWMSNTSWDQKKPKDDYHRGYLDLYENRLTNLIFVVENQLLRVIEKDKKINRDSRAFHLLSRLHGNILFDEAIRSYLLKRESFKQKLESYVDYLLARMPAEKHFEMMLDWLDMTKPNQKKELGEILGLTNFLYEGTIDEFCSSMFQKFQVKQKIEEDDAKRNLLYLCHVVSSKKVLNAACELLHSDSFGASPYFTIQSP